MTRSGIDLAFSIQTRLILASVGILMLAVLITSGVFVYRERQGQRAETLKAIASATSGFTVSKAPIVHLNPGLGEGDPGEPQLVPGTITATATEPAADGTARVFSIASGNVPLSPEYRIILVDREGEVVEDPAGTLAGTRLEYPAAGTADIKRGYMTWKGDVTTAADGLTFLAPIAARQTGTGLTAVAAIDSTSLTADWLATFPDLALSALAALPLAVAAVVLVTRRITHPLRRLTNAVDALSRGDFDQRVEVEGRDEVAALASSFTVMAGRVRERDTQLRNLIANVSHDLRTPLTSIQGYAEALVDGVAGPADIEKAAQIIRDEARHASSLLNNLLELSEIDSGEVVMRYSEFSPADLVERCLRRLEPRAKERGITFAIEVSGLPVLVGDAGKTERVLCNLMENAVKFARSRVTVTSGLTPEGVMIAISNDGPPISVEQASRIFERYYRAPGPEAGSGLGLAIARELVSLLGGRLELTSASSPVTFRVTLPRGT